MNVLFSFGLPKIHMPYLHFKVWQRSDVVRMYASKGYVFWLIDILLVIYLGEPGLLYISSYGHIILGTRCTPREIIVNGLKDESCRIVADLEKVCLKNKNCQVNPFKPQILGVSKFCILDHLDHYPGS